MDKKENMIDLPIRSSGEIRQTMEEFTRKLLLRNGLPIVFQDEFGTFLSVSVSDAASPEGGLPLLLFRAGHMFQLYPQEYSPLKGIQLQEFKGGLLQPLFTNKVIDCTEAVDVVNSKNRGFYPILASIAVAVEDCQRMSGGEYLDLTAPISSFATLNSLGLSKNLVLDLQGIDSEDPFKTIVNTEGLRAAPMSKEEMQKHINKDMADIAKRILSPEDQKKLAEFKASRANESAISPS